MERLSRQAGAPNPAPQGRDGLHQNAAACSPEAPESRAKGPALQACNLPACTTHVSPPLFMHKSGRVKHGLLNCVRYVSPAPPVPAKACFRADKESLFPLPVRGGTKGDKTRCPGGNQKTLQKTFLPSPKKDSVLLFYAPPKKHINSSFLQRKVTFQKPPSAFEIFFVPHSKPPPSSVILPKLPRRELENVAETPPKKFSSAPL